MNLKKISVDMLAFCQEVVDHLDLLLNRKLRFSLAYVVNW